MTGDQPEHSFTPWIDTHVPEESQVVRAQARDDGGFYIVQFPVVFRDDAWWNAETGQRLHCLIAGWLPWE